jgi:hypothetical protein
MKDALSKTNSWHWLGLAVVLSALASLLVWRQVFQHIAREHAPVVRRQQAHLEELRLLTESQVGTLNLQIDEAEKRLERLRAEIRASGVQPIPEGTDSLLAMKNAIDGALADNRLRVTGSDIRVPAPAPAASAAAASAAPDTARQPAPASAQSYDEAINSIKDKKLRDMIIAEEKRRSKGVKAAPAAAATAPGPGRAKSAPAARGAKPAPAPAAPAPDEKLPFKTVDVNYTVEGDYKNMFLFLVGQSFKKPSYHLKNITVSRIPDGGMRMSFIAQVNYREKN